jgi:hypothetical protein
MNVTADYIREVMGLSRAELGERMRSTELEQGFTIVDAQWIDWNDWMESTIITQDGKRIRLVALEAREPGKGAFTRLIAKIWKAGLIPVIVEPNRSLTDWCLRHDYRCRRIGKGRFAHEVWYPRK